MPNDKTKIVTAYTVRFKGLYGRKRSIDSTYSKEIVGPEIADEAFLANLVDTFAIAVKPKHGIFSVIRYANCEQYAMEASNGQVLHGLSIPITDGGVVYRREVAAPTKK